MVRLVFRPYTQVRRSICTSESLRASTRVSSGFALLRHSSPSFGSQQIRSCSNLSKNILIGRWCTREGSHLLFTFISHPSLSPKYSRICQTPWSVFQDGSFKTISSTSSALKSLAHLTTKHTRQSIRLHSPAYSAIKQVKPNRTANSSLQASVPFKGYNTQPKLCYLPSKYFHSPKMMLT